MSFPAYGTPVPGLSAYQFSYNGYSWGPGLDMEMTKIEGVDMPAVRSGDSNRPRDHGRFIGLDVMDGREITVTAELLTTSTAAAALFANATIPGGSTETGLYVNLPNYGTLVSMARVRKRSMPIDIKAALGNLVDVALLFAASDPRWYSTPTMQATVGIPTSSAGFSFPLTFPLAFGGGGVAGSLAVTNNGNIETRPILTVTGPCTTPTITNASIAGNPSLSFGVSLNAGDTLVLDTDMHTAIYTTAGSTLGSNRLNTLQAGSTWWTLVPGPNNLQFSTQDASPVAGTLSVTYASAYLL